MGLTQSQGPSEREAEAAESGKEIGLRGWSDAITGFEGGEGQEPRNLGSP